ncbi:hypothetical protein B0H66DRAFT_299126 [Apodospora peruviana]|uniref:Ubiquitin-like domain-containing protein n=1 Tax=Apodospora peruviana TaxID=516989 RepID=A0AAE0I174_9PEZI|nr:hypothetical protein B0H66DRAFT_299126 [Apodospora peruviana]
MAAVSVGDVIAIGKLIKDVTKVLSDSNGSRAEFAGVSADLESLEIALRQTEGVVFENPRRNRDMKKVVRSTSVLLDDFATMLGKYRPYLQPGGSGNWASDAIRQLRFSLRRPEEVKRFREQISCRLDSLHIIMSTANYSRILNMGSGTPDTGGDLNGAATTGAAVKDAQPQTSDTDSTPTQHRIERGKEGQGSNDQRMADLMNSVLGSILSGGTVRFTDALGVECSFLLSEINTWEDFEYFLVKRFPDKRHQHKIKLGEYALRRSGENEYIPSHVPFLEAFRSSSHVRMSMVFDGSFSGQCPKCSRDLRTEQPPRIQCSSCRISIDVLESDYQIIDPLTAAISDYGVTEDDANGDQLHNEFLIRLWDLDRLSSLDDNGILRFFGFSDHELSPDQQSCLPSEFVRITLCTPTWPRLPSQTRVFAHTQPLIQSLQTDDVIVTALGGDNGPVVQAVGILSRLSSIQLDIELRLKTLASAARTLPRQYGWRISRLRLFTWATIAHIERVVQWVVWLRERAEREAEAAERGLGAAQSALKNMSIITFVLLLWPLCQHNKKLLPLYSDRAPPPSLSDETRLQKIEVAVFKLAPPVIIMACDIKSMPKMLAVDYPATRGVYPEFAAMTEQLEVALRSTTEKTDWSEVEPNAKQAILEMDRSSERDKKVQTEAEKERKRRQNKTRYSGKRTGPYWGQIADQSYQDDSPFKEVTNLLVPQILGFADTIRELTKSHASMATKGLKNLEKAAARVSQNGRCYNSDSDSD